jgi:hypothetical protein
MNSVSSKTVIDQKAPFSGRRFPRRFEERGLVAQAYRASGIVDAAGLKEIAKGATALTASSDSDMAARSGIWSG